MKGNKVYTLVGILDYDGFPSIDRERWEIKGVNEMGFNLTVININDLYDNG